ncbi:MAG: hypothetical protein K6E28_10065 [Eubacterium sp.]|nr:hypothetical protein [Eubacterium sp.]
MKIVSRSTLKVFSVGLIFAMLLSACDAPHFGKKKNEFTVAGAEGGTEAIDVSGDNNNTVGNNADDNNVAGNNAAGNNADGNNTDADGNDVKVADGTLGDEVAPAGLFETDVNSVSVSYDTGKMEGWQKAFYDQLVSVQGESLQKMGDSSFPVPSDGYFVYDADDDGTPELFIKFGTCEADYFLKIYKFEGGKAVEIASTGCGHTSFYSMPEKGYISVWAHMGYYGASKVHLNGNELSGENIYDADFNQNPDADYPKMKDLVPGAEYLDKVDTNIFLPLIIYNYIPSTSEGLSDDEVKARSESLINNGGNVFCVTGDNFGETKGNVDFNTYLTKGYASPYDNYRVVGYDYHDLNSDGQKECVIKVKNTEHEDSDGSIIVISFQNKVTYAYSLNFVSGNLSFNDDGSFIENTEYGSGHRFYFYKDQAYLTFIE